MSTTVPAQQYDAIVAEKSALQARLAALESELQSAQRQLDWFKRQLFGAKSEKRLEIDPAVQASLFAGLIEDAPPPPETETIEITRRKKTRDGAVNDTGLRFDEGVPVRVIEVAPPADLADGAIIATHSTFRLAQRRASTEVLEYRTPVIKTSPEAAPQTTPVPGAIFTGSLADVSFLAGMIVDKFCYHLPLYRQHQRLAAGGIQLARATLTQLVARTAALLSPIHLAQLEHVLQSRVLAMDETPIKAGHKTKGKLESGDFWPLYGDADEISFTFSPSRGRQHIEDTLAEHFNGTLVTDGYAAYARYAEARPGVTHAQCWAHYPERSFIWSSVRRMLYSTGIRRRPYRDKIVMESLVTDELRSAPEPRRHALYRGQVCRCRRPGSAAIGASARHVPGISSLCCAAALLQSGTAVSVIRAYLEQASIATTTRYLAANLKMKRDALETLWKHAGIERAQASCGGLSPIYFLSTLVLCGYSWPICADIQAIPHRTPDKTTLWIMGLIWSSR